MNLYRCMLCGEMDSTVDNGICRGCASMLAEHGCPECGSMNPATTYKGYPGEVMHVCPDCGHTDHDCAEEVFEWMV